MSKQGGFPRPMSKKLEANLLRGTVDEYQTGGGDPRDYNRPWHTGTVLMDLAAERALNTGQSPLDFLLEVMRDTRNNVAVRMFAARSAAPYVHARLAHIEPRPADGADARIVFIGGVLAPSRKDLDLEAVN